MKRRKLLLIVLLIAASTLVIISLIKIDLTGEIPRIKSAIESGTGRHVELEGVILRILPKPRLTITGFTLMDQGETLIRAESIEAGVAIIALLKKNIIIKSLEITRLNAFIKRNAEGALNLNGLKGKNGFSVSLKTLKLKDSNIQFIDEAIEPQRTYAFKDIKAYLYTKDGDFSYTIGFRLEKGGVFYTSGSAKKRSGAGWGGSETELSGTFTVNDFSIENIAPYIKGSLKDVELKGSVSADLIYSVSGEAFKEKTLLKGIGLIKGSVTSKDFEVGLPAILTNPVRSMETMSNIEVEWDKDKVKFASSDMSLKLEGFKLGGSLNIALPEKTVELDLFTTPIDADYFKKFMPSKILPLRINRVVDEVKNLKGAVEIKSLKFSNKSPGIKNGIKKANDFLKALSLTADVKGLGFSHKFFKMPFSDLDGAALLKDGRISIASITGRYSKTSLTRLSGEVVIGETPYMDISMDGAIDAEEILNELKKAAPLKLLVPVNAKGHVNVNIGIKGVPPYLGGSQKDALKITTALDLTPVQLSYGEMLKKPSGYPLNMKGVISVGKKGISQDGSLKVGNSQIGIKADISRLDPSYMVSLAGGNVMIADMLPVFTPFAKYSPSKGEMELTWTKKRNASGVEDKKGEFRVRNGLLKTPFFERVIRDLNGVFSFTNNTGKVRIEGLKIGESNLYGSVNITDWKNRIIDFNILSDGFDTKDLAGGRFESGGKPPVTGGGKLMIKGGRLRGVAFTSFSTDVLMLKDAVLLEPLTFTTHNGTVSGAITYHRGVVPQLFDSYFKVSRVEISPLIKDLGAKADIMSGRVTAEVKLSGKRIKPAASGIDGEIRFLASDGRLWKFVVLSKIFSIVNIISINELFDQGFPYNEITGSFAVKDGIFFTEDLLFESNSMKMSAVMSIDAAKKTITATMGMHPFVTIDKIISNIPLAGWIIGGEEESAITMYYEIKGPLKKPEVEAVPIKSIGSGIFGILKRTLTLPIKAVEPLTK